MFLKYLDVRAKYLKFNGKCSETKSWKLFQASQARRVPIGGMPRASTVVMAGNT
jgi:hypothetical protein